MPQTVTMHFGEDVTLRQHLPQGHLLDKHTRNHLVRRHRNTLEHVAVNTLEHSENAGALATSSQQPHAVYVCLDHTQRGASMRYTVLMRVASPRPKAHGTHSGWKHPWRKPGM